MLIVCKIKARHCTALLKRFFDLMTNKFCSSFVVSLYPVIATNCLILLCIPKLMGPKGFKQQLTVSADDLDVPEMFSKQELNCIQTCKHIVNKLYRLN